MIFELFKHILPKLRGDYYELGYKYIKDFPIMSPSDKSIENLVLERIKTGNKDIDHQIDQLVYQLYGLTEEEIGIVEGEGR